ncbi:MAG: P-type conjugative transfer protein TrbG [Alphaproteobacteria bacterium RIFCSPHIGHO2_12_FULL_63_12]|nr:MAG: P-type conjugative transfer protein TrbG [Alphaproteobacteria bacterium RIFCSPHIGHO2_12_FULL_63_12]
MTRLILILSSLALMGCETAYPDIALDAAPMRPAKIVSFDDGKPVREIIETATPFPLPGQLKPVEENEAPSPELKPFEQIDTANSLAKVEPDLARFVNAVQVYPFMEGALYRLYAAPEQVTDIALEPGERLNSVSAGDTVRWVVGDTASGTAAGERVHILVKPIAPDLSTNLVIATDRRAYHLEMRSFRETYMAAISWTYPQDQLVKRREDASRAKAAADSVVAPSINPDHLKFRYEIEGDRPHWRPVRAFDDGEQVFIQFPEAIAQGEVPPLFVLSHDGKPELVNYRMRGNYYVVDRLFSAAELRLGEKRQSVVRILRTDLKGRI